jgi:hypothetical protein
MPGYHVKANVVPYHAFVKYVDSRRDKNSAAVIERDELLGNPVDKNEVGRALIEKRE